MKPALRWAARLALVLLISEVLLRLLFSYLPLTSRLSRTGRTGRMLYEIEQLEQAEKIRRIDISHKKGRGELQTDRVLGWINSPGKMPNSDLRVTVNQQGMRADHEYPISKPIGKSLRVEVFGDSFAFGRDVNDEEAFAAQLQAMRPQFDVLNFGVPGYGLDQSVLRFERDGSRFHPDVVILNGIGTLQARVNTDFTTWFKPYYTLDKGELKLHGTPIPTVEEAESAYERRPRLLDFFNLMRDFEWTNPKGDSPLEESLLHRFVSDVHAAGARPLLLLAPYEASDYDLIDSPEFRRLCETKQIECLDVLPDFKKAAAASVTLTTTAHWSRQGNGIVAEKLAAGLDAMVGTVRP